MIITPEQVRRKTVAACQAALTKRRRADRAGGHLQRTRGRRTALHRSCAAPRRSPPDADLDEIAAILNEAQAITIYAGAGCAGSHDEVVATAARLKAPMAHTSRGKDFVEYDNPYNVGMSGIIGQPAGYRAILNCDVLLTLGCDFAWSQFYPNKAKIIQIDADPTHIGRRHPVTIGAVGDIKATLEALLPRLVQHDDNGFLSHYVERHPKDRAAAEVETVSHPNATIPDVPRQDHKQACGRGCVVHGRRRHYAARMTAAGPFTGELHKDRVVRD
jgi:pyruvate dehydrogenase (quinone)